MLNDLKELIAIPSVLAESAPNAPFGLPVRAALDWFLAKAKEYGLKTKDENGYCGWAEYGEGAEMVGILCHLDVVPCGDGWTNPPYQMTCDNGNIYGRGVVDDKGSAVVALHILKKLREDKTALKRRVRLIVGCNEENGSACINYYREHCEIPTMSFVPDADFPIINSEKGIAHLTVSIPKDDFFTRNISQFAAGSRPNIVPDICTLSVIHGSELEEKILQLAGENRDNSIFNSREIATKILLDGWKIEDYSIHFFSDKISLAARGIAGHAMNPSAGENAFWKMITLLNALQGGKATPLLSAITYAYCNPLAAERLGISANDDCSGELTINVGVVKTRENFIDLTLDLRLPICSKIDDVTKNILEKMPSGSALEIDHWSPNLFIQKDNPLIQILLKTYGDVTGKESYCVRCGGGTYARELPNSVAFGPTFPGAETNIHNIDEHISLKEFYKLFDIYYQAALNLANDY